MGPIFLTICDTSNIERATAFPSFLHPQSKQSCLAWNVFVSGKNTIFTTATKTLALIFTLEFSLNLSSGGTSSGGICLRENGNWMHSGVQRADHMYSVVLLSLAQTLFIKHLNCKVLGVFRAKGVLRTYMNTKNSSKYFKVFLKKKKSSVLNFNF